MTCSVRVRASILSLALLAPLLHSTPARAQGEIPPNPAIDITYVPPTDTALQPIHDRLRYQDRILEQLRQVLSPLKLAPRRLHLRVEQCGATIKFYEPDGPATICYEYIQELIRVAPPPGSSATWKSAQRVSRDATIVGGVVQLALHEVAVAALNILEVPVWGRESDAADRLAAYIMMKFGPDVALRTVLGAAWYFTKTDRPWTVTDYADLRHTEMQRYYNTLCMAYGNREMRNSFKFLVDDLWLPKSRADRCEYEYYLVGLAFDRLVIRPHVDGNLMARVKAAQWLQ